MTRHVDCKKGLHMFSPAGPVGGGIIRRTCSVCGFVQIDLTEGSVVSDPNLFSEPTLVSIFQVEALLARVSEVAVSPPSRSFGEAPAGRRRPARVTG